MRTEEPMLMCLRHTGKNHSALYWGKYNVTKGTLGQQEIYLWKFVEMFPPSYKYPDYCNGQCAVMNRKALLRIEQQSSMTALDDFRIEDIFFTGILRQKAGVTRVEDFISVILLYLIVC